jgi:cell division protein FtsQ
MPRQAEPTPVDVRIMHAATGLLVLAMVGLVLVAGARWLAAKSIFELRAIRVAGDVSRNNAATLRANAVPRLAGNFLTMDLQRARSAFEAVPWVRHASVRRVWPMRVEVTLEEHKPAAYWETKADGADSNSDASVDRQLVNSFGEVFQANLGDVEDEDLPTLAGPEGSAQQMLRMYQLLEEAVRPLDETVDRLDLSGRGSWRATLDKGEVIEIGRGDEAEVLARVRRFVSSISQVVSTSGGAPLVSADLRHADGYAVRLQGVKTQPTPGKSRK